MGDTVQPGSEIDEAIWQRFRKEVERRKGGTRGHIRNELERALQAYNQGGDATLEDIDARLQRIEGAVGAAPTDGGADAPSPSSQPAETHTHTQQAQPEDLQEKPDAKSTRDRKVAYLAGCVEEYTCDDFETISKNDIADIVREEYGFRSKTAKTYINDLISHFDLVEHPLVDDWPLLITREKCIELRQEEAAKEAEAAADEQADATPVGDQQ
jgi:hypothetical protein